MSSNEKNSKLGQRGHVGSRDPILEFWDLSYMSRERLKLETLNLARRWKAVSSNKKKIQNRVKRGHVLVT